LEASFRHVPPGDKKERAVFYEKTRKAIADEIPNAGGLITNHLMGIFAITGIVPLWFAEEHSVDTQSKSICFFVENKGLTKGKPAAQRFLDSVSTVLHHEYGILCTRKYSENVGCKCFRMECTECSDSKFSDLVFDRQCVFEVVSGEVHVHRRGCQKVVVKGSLVNRWALGGRFWNIPQLILNFGSTAKVGFRLPRGLGDQGGNRLVLEWTIQFFPPTFIVRNWHTRGNKTREMVQKLINEL
jgi:hypothetical protein